MLSLLPRSRNPLEHIVTVGPNQNVSASDRQVGRPLQNNAVYFLYRLMLFAWVRFLTATEREAGLRSASIQR